MTTPVSHASPGKTVGLADDGSRSRQRLEEVAREFESLFIHQMLRQMRDASRWLGNEEDALFGTRLMETIDFELARQLATGGGVGLTEILMPRLLEGAGDLRLPPAAGPAPSVSDGSRPVATDPLASERVTSDFGYRNDPITANRRFHAGVDLRAAYGRKIGAAESGRVVFAGEDGGYGLTVVVEHGPDLRTRYAHLSSITVTEGDSVNARQLIGRAGQTGRATGSHLHFELIHKGRPVDPVTMDGGLSGLLQKLRLSAD